LKKITKNSNHPRKNNSFNRYYHEQINVYGIDL